MRGGAAGRRPARALLGERGRLTALYGGLVLLSGGVLVALVYALVRHDLTGTISTALGHGAAAPATREGGATPAPGPRRPPSADLISTFHLASQGAADAVLNHLLAYSGIALAVFALLSLALAWWMAGRVLRPVGVITSTARRLSTENLHQRIELDAPPGELKELADTFDEMLDRIERLMESQKRFVANAAHELRTPLAVQRAAAEIGLARPTPERVDRVRRHLIAVAQESEQLIEGLLLLSVTDRGLTRREQVCLAELVHTAVTGLAPRAEEAEVKVHTDAEHGTGTDEGDAGTVDGDPVLLGHLITNLLGNALRHNVRGGTVDVRVRGRVLCVSNTGQRVPAQVVPELFEPFRRLEDRRQVPGEGAGLGLSIVASIAHAHGAAIEATANPGGGLTVSVSFPAGPRAAPRPEVRLGRPVVPGHS
ncbi:sensor histidine kinase [Streptomyces sp. NPDC059009]|uniref:sensor histidine kinase n=1 Tax=Streptomyces sp. NPDC059009 TaxID=3346694 RepID=UPI00368110EF